MVDTDDVSLRQRPSFMSSLWLLYGVGMRHNQDDRMYRERNSFNITTKLCIVHAR